MMLHTSCVEKKIVKIQKISRKLLILPHRFYILLCYCYWDIK